MTATLDTLTPPKLMSAGELRETWKNYERRILAHLLHDAPGLSDAEKAHALEVEAEYHEWLDAVRFTFQSRH